MRLFPALALTPMLGCVVRYSPMRMKANGAKVSHVHIRYVNPMPNDLGAIFEKFDHIIITEMNDEGVYGNGQLATLLRARYCNPAIRSICKTDGLSFKVREIIAGIDQITSEA